MSSRAGAGLLDADASEQLGEIDERLARLDVELRARVNEAEQATIQTAWQEELAGSRGASVVQRAVVLSGPQIAAISGTAVVVATGTGTTPLSGGLVPAVNARAFEFGALDPQGHLGQAKSRKGALYPRHTQRQMPTRSQTGWIAYPAAKRLGKRLAQLLQATIVKFTYDAIDGGQ